jgi:hypothetical protein
MTAKSLRNKSCVPQKPQKRCGRNNGIFGQVRLIKDEDWKDIAFVSEKAKALSVLVVMKTEPEPFGGFYIRRWDHPYEPNFETRTYNLLEFCQQKKVRKFFETGRAGNLIVWTRDEKTREPYFIGAYERIVKLRKVEGLDHEKWKPRTALMALSAYVVPYGKRISMKDFEEEFKKRGLSFPSKKKRIPYESCYGLKDILDRELAEPIMGVTRDNAMESKEFRGIGELHTREMLRKQRELKEKRSRTSVDRFQKRFVTMQDMNYALRAGIL